MAKKTDVVALAEADAWTQIATGDSDVTLISVSGVNPVHICIAAAEVDIDTELAVGHRLSHGAPPLNLPANGEPIWARVLNGDSQVVVTQYDIPA